MPAMGISPNIIAQDYAIVSDAYAPNSRTFKPVNDAGGQAGELMIVAVLGGQYSGNLALNVSSITGWTEIAKTAGWTPTSAPFNAIAAALWARRLDGTETSDVSFMQSGAGYYHSQVLRFSGGMSPITKGSAIQKNGTSDLSEGTIGSGSLSRPAIVVSIAGQTAYNSTAVAGVEFDESGGAQDVEDEQYVSRNGQLSWDIRYKIYNNGWDDVVIDMSDTGSQNINALVGNYIT